MYLTYLRYGGITLPHTCDFDVRAHSIILTPTLHPVEPGTKKASGYKYVSVPLLVCLFFVSIGAYLSNTGCGLLIRRVATPRPVGPLE